MDYINAVIVSAIFLLTLASIAFTAVGVEMVVSSALDYFFNNDLLTSNLLPQEEICELMGGFKRKAISIGAAILYVVYIILSLIKNIRK